MDKPLEPFKLERNQWLSGKQYPVTHPIDTLIEAEINRLRQEIETLKEEIKSLKNVQ